ncbi:MAG: hypothetical protein HYW86_02960 [Candidatus Roizmanbacteria bacterium]|nr:MAG: hypothetical protein HYW86_02960 [Candidatus Roizmanbacteria bacterium]
MKISVDGGGLCASEDQRFGNYTFSRNFLQALNKYDKENEYFVYTFCNLNEGTEHCFVPTLFNKRIKFEKLLPKKFWMKGRVTLEEILNRKDIFFALNQALPLYTSAKIISFSHGLSFYFHPEYYPNDYHRLKNQLNEMLKRSQYIIVSSQKVKNEIASLSLAMTEKIKIMPFGIPFDMEDYVPHRREKYFMYVGMNTPVKNIDFLKQAFNKFNIKAEYKLYMIDSNIKRDELRKMYAKATGYLTASHYESFNFPVLEALSQKCPVIALKSAIIPEMEGYVDVVGDADLRPVHYKNEFVKKMIAIANGKHKKIDRIKLLKDFSWKNCINKLQNLYYYE